MEEKNENTEIVKIDEVHTLEIIGISSKDGDNLTKYEKSFLERDPDHCPDCQVGTLVEGPHGGMSVNYYCSNDTSCGSKFNLSFFNEKLFLAQRISDRSPKAKKLSECVAEYLTLEAQKPILIKNKEYEKASHLPARQKDIKEAILNIFKNRFPDESEDFLLKMFHVLLGTLK